MLRTILRLYNIKPGCRFSSKLKNHESPNCSAPLIEIYRSTWPDPDYYRSISEDNSESSKPPELVLPPRTIPDSALRFRFKATFEAGSAIHYKHLQINPADFKVVMRVAIPDLNLNDTERRIFVRMVGPRYQQGRHEVKLVSDRFPNRLENKKYLIYLLESLLLETRRLCAEKDTLSLPRPAKDDNDEVEGIPRIL